MSGKTNSQGRTVPGGPTILPGLWLPLHLMLCMRKSNNFAAEFACHLGLVGPTDLHRGYFEQQPPTIQPSPALFISLIRPQFIYKSCHLSSG